MADQQSAPGGNANGGGNGPPTNVNGTNQVAIPGIGSDSTSTGQNPSGQPAPTKSYYQSPYCEDTATGNPENGNLPNVGINTSNSGIRPGLQPLTGSRHYQAQDSAMLMGNTQGFTFAQVAGTAGTKRARSGAGSNEPNKRLTNYSNFFNEQILTPRGLHSANGQIQYNTNSDGQLESVRLKNQPNATNNALTHKTAGGTNVVGNFQVTNEGTEFMVDTIRGLANYAGATNPNQRFDFIFRPDPRDLRPTSQMRLVPGPRLGGGSRPRRRLPGSNTASNQAAPQSLGPQVSQGSSGNRAAIRNAGPRDSSQQNAGSAGGVQSSTNCVNCGKHGHTLAVCVGPPNQVHGDINGCPKCNTISHNYDNCPIIEHNNLEEVFQLLVHNRINKPPIRSKFTSWIQVLHVIRERDRASFPADYNLPWTKDFTRTLIQSSNPPIHPWIDYNYAEEPGLPRDNITKNIDAFIQGFFQGQLGPQVQNPGVRVSAASGVLLNRAQMAKRENEAWSEEMRKSVPSFGNAASGVRQLANNVPGGFVFGGAVSQNPR